MNERSYGTFRARVIKLPAWQIAIIGAGAAALVLTLAVVATGIFLLVFPVMIALDWFYRWRHGKPRGRTETSARAPDATIITTDYEVLPPERSSADERR